MKENEVIHSSLNRPIANLLVPKNKNQFRLLDDPDSDNRTDYETKGKKLLHMVISYFSETLV